MQFLKERRAFSLKLVVSLGLIGFILTHIEVQRVGSLLVSVEVRYLALALVLVALERGLFAYKWKVLLATKGIEISFWTMLKIYYISNFLGNFLPSSISVDVIRAYQLRKHTGNLLESVSSVLADKALSLFALLIVPVIVAVVYAKISGDLRLVWLSTSLLGGFCLCFIILINQTVIRQALRAALKISPRLAEWLKMLHESMHGYLAYKRALSVAFIVSVVIQITRVLGIFALGLALGQQVSVVFYFIFVPIINLLATLPISVSGIGITEGGFVYFFSLVGMAPSDAFALSILGYLTVAVSVLPGGVLFMLGERSGRKQAVSSGQVPNQPSELSKNTSG